jgi:glycerate-2-kinase
MVRRRLHRIRQGIYASMVKLVKIVAALVALLFGFLWLMTAIASGFTVPVWVPATGLFAAGVYCTMDAFGF